LRNTHKAGDMPVAQRLFDDSVTRSARRSAAPASPRPSTAQPAADIDAVVDRLHPTQEWAHPVDVLYGVPDAPWTPSSAEAGPSRLHERLHVHETAARRATPDERDTADNQFDVSAFIGPVSQLLARVRRERPADTARPYTRPGPEKPGPRKVVSDNGAYYSTSVAWAKARGEEVGAARSKNEATRHAAEDRAMQPPASPVKAQAKAKAAAAASPRHATNDAYYRDSARWETERRERRAAARAVREQALAVAEDASMVVPPSSPVRRHEKKPASPVRHQQPRPAAAAPAVCEDEVSRYIAQCERQVAHEAKAAR
jgi:hypothetical protein